MLMEGAGTIKATRVTFEAEYRSLAGDVYKLPEGDDAP
jgi:hypothetical protein